MSTIGFFDLRGCKNGGGEENPTWGALKVWLQRFRTGATFAPEKRVKKDVWVGSQKGVWCNKRKIENVTQGGRRKKTAK